MKCSSCNWMGSRGDLLLNKSSNPVNSFNLTFWNKCPNCNSQLGIPLSYTDITTSHHGSVMSIRSRFGDTYVHLHRILDFVVQPFGLSILGYKHPRQTFKLNVSLEGTEEHRFQSKIILKILHLAHKSRYDCLARTIDNLQMFGKWDRFNSDYPWVPCSFCARMYEFETQNSNGWPFSLSSLENIKLNRIRKLANVPIFRNKFTQLFSEPEELKEENKTEKLICSCNEISLRPNPDCDIHKTWTGSTAPSTTGITPPFESTFMRNLL